MGGNSAKASGDAVRRLGPMVRKGSRIPMRSNKTGSVMIHTPKKFISTVECPSHAAVRSWSLQFPGLGLVNAGAMERRLSTVHSRQRCASQLRRVIFRPARARSLSIANNSAEVNGAMLQRCGDLKRVSGRTDATLVSASRPTVHTYWLSEPAVSRTLLYGR